MNKIFKAVNKMEELASSLTNTMDRDLNKVQEVLDFDFNDLLEVVKRQPKKDRDKLCSILLNTNLEKLKNITMQQYREVCRDADEITDYYVAKSEGFDAVVEEGDTVANDLLFKLIDNKKSRIELPIDIELLKKYSFSSNLKEEQFYDTLMWITLRYIAINRCLIWKKCDEEYEKSKAVNSSKN